MVVFCSAFRLPCGSCCCDLLRVVSLPKSAEELLRGRCVLQVKVDDVFMV